MIIYTSVYISLQRAAWKNQKNRNEENKLPDDAVLDAVLPPLQERNYVSVNVVTPENHLS